ncbi:unnamed protein product [Mytilus coruscus]|uniref:Integrase catalytic domain-containing protein n=1 Tax=Mytilus coruscus TaxID=42192 RepID=A0A6J8CZX7_MYTCO|nr:unnamed protein product [Mytilus coruscus]
MLPFRQLLKPGTPFFWDEHINKLFKESKAAIISEIEEGVRIFDKSKPTCLATDWSKTGSEPFCCNKGWRITLVGSRFTHPAESRYARVEGEALAVVDTLDKARYFVLGCDLIIAVDHKPLLKIFSDRSLEDISNSRLRNLKEKTLRYHFRMIHVPGVKHHAADGVSRHQTVEPEKLILTDDIAAIKNNTISLPPATSFLSGIHHSDLESDATKIDNSVIITAVSSLDSLAVRSVTWDIVRTATESDDTPSKPNAPPTPLMSPDYPFQCVCSDFFQYKGICYLVIVDRYSNWPIVERSSDGAVGLITCLRRTFVTFGIPDELASDGGPGYTSTATKQFLQDWGVHIAYLQCLSLIAIAGRKLE